MKRRDFLKLSGILGAGASFSLPSMQVFGAVDNYTGPLWLIINADGGWDPTSLFDPKGYTDPADPNRLNNYPSSSIIQAPNNSPLRYAPPPDSFLTNTTLYNAKTFYDKYYQKMLVFNGVDTRTNSHEDGQRHSWSGEMSRLGFPSIGALIAGVAAPARPMSYITNGGYANTGGLTVASRMKSYDLAPLYEVAYPNRSQDASSSGSQSYFPEGVTAARSLIKAASDARTQSLYDAQRLLRLKETLGKLRESRSGPSSFAAMTNNLATNIRSRTQASFPGRYVAYELYDQGHIALAAYQSGVAAAVQLEIGGFDTHSNHDATHYPRLMDLLSGLDAILSEAETRGLADKIVVIVGSDFGRTNIYNADNGKDHWPITSMMVMGNSAQTIRGNRVIGATTATHNAMWINPTTLAAVPANTAGAVRLTPGVIHQSLRRLAGVDTALAATTTFPLTVPALSLFA
jgi:uncharacterized protein (DUF1501 family)